MVTTYLVDTDVISEPARPHPSPALLAALGENAGACAIAATTWHELRFGVERLPAGRRRDGLMQYVRALPARFPVLPYDHRAADWHGRQRARWDAAGTTRPFADGQIAAVAVTHGLVLVTRNTAHFRGIDGLQLESWD